MILGEHYFEIIERNAAQCLVCMDVVESKYQHDFRACSCGNVHVDGGRSYLRRSYKAPDMVLDMSKQRRMTQEELLNRREKCYADKAAYMYSTGYIDSEIDSIKHYLNLWYPSQPKQPDWN